MARVQIVLDHEGMDAMLKSYDVARGLDKTAQRIASNARMLDPHHGAGPIVVEVRHRIIRTRAAAYVNLIHPVARHLEKKHRILGKAARMK